VLTYEQIAKSESQLAALIEQRADIVRKGATEPPELREATHALATEIVKGEIEIVKSRVVKIMPDLDGETAQALRAALETPSLTRGNRDDILKSYERVAAEQRVARRLQLAIGRSTLALQGGSA
jgi:hypothetical protein